nr:TerB family tellurite resistance protein [Prevotella sp.]
MAAGKWIGGALGFITFGPLGALAGYALGYFFEKGMDNVNNEDNNYNNAYDAYEGRGGSSYGPGTYGESTRYRQQTGQRNSFLFSLLVLSSYIIKADGKVMHSEMNFVRQFLQKNFGVEAKIQGEDILKKLFQKQDEIGINQFHTIIRDSCNQISTNMPYEQRIQLLNYLALIAKADGVVSQEEVTALREIAICLGLSATDAESMLNLNDAGTNLEAAYKVMGVDANATDDEVKKAYRKAALANHPDRVATLGEDVRKAAEKKFQEINAAKELIWKARGL